MFGIFKKKETVKQVSYPSTTEAGTPFKNKIEQELYFTKPEYKKMMDDKDQDNLLYQINAEGIEAEKNGDINLAIALYEKNISNGFNGSHPYKRLAIIYRKQKKYDDEIRVLQAAIKNTSKSEWFTNRLTQVQELKAKG